MSFEIEGVGLKLENDFLIRIRHFFSDEVRYPVLRLLLSPLMLFDKTTVIPRTFIDFGENIEVNEEFHLKIETSQDETVLSNAFMSVSSILKAQSKGTETATSKISDALIKVDKSDVSNDNLFSIGGEEEIEEKQAKIEKVSKLVETEPKRSQNSEEEEDDDDEYLKSLENRA